LTFELGPLHHEVRDRHEMCQLVRLEDVIDGPRNLGLPRTRCVFRLRRCWRSWRRHLLKAARWFKTPAQSSEAVLLLVMELAETEWKTTPATSHVEASLSLVEVCGRTACVFRVQSPFGHGWTSHWAPAALRTRKIAVPSVAHGGAGWM